MTAQRIPRIGISTYREPAAWGLWNERADVLHAAYADLVVRSGGAAMLLPPAGDAATADAVVSALDGLILSGGADIDPARYGAVAGRHTDTPRTDRDNWEFLLAQAAFEQKLPVLGICRGMQLLNVALGGTLIQHLPDLVSDGGRAGASSDHCRTPGVFGHHVVAVAGDGITRQALGADSVEVASHHHQGIERLADELSPTAWSDDGLIEAFERRGPGWVVGVQWHPEALGGDQLMRSFINVCRGAPA